MVFSMESLRTIKLGERQGAPRIWLQGKYLLAAGFARDARYVVHVETNKLTLRLSNEGDRKISGKEDIPVIDLNNRELGTIFQSCETLQVLVASHCITITPAVVETKKQTRCENGKVGSVFSGGGTLDQAAKMAGQQTAWGIEIEAAYAEIFAANFPEAKLFNCCVSNVPLAALEPIETLLLGIPCQPFSKARTINSDGSKRDKKLVSEAHELGDMTAWAMVLIHHLNPKTIIIEQVPGFLDSGAGWMMRHFLERLGYFVDAKIVDPVEFGEIAARKRAVMVAHSEPIAWPEPSENSQRLGDYLDSNVPETSWFDRLTKSWLFEHWEQQTAKGNGFEPPKLTAASKHVPTIKKRYFAGQGDAPVVAHPTKPNTFRWFTVAEVKRLHGLPDDYYLGETKTVAGEILGQGVVVGFFTKLLNSIARGLHDIAVCEPYQPALF